MLAFSESLDAILDDDHGAIHDQPEVERTETHEICTDFRLDHACHKHQHRERDHHRGEQRRTHVAEHEKQYHNNQNGAFEQVLLHGGDGLVHQYRAVVHGVGGDASRQALVDLRQFRRHVPRHRATVLANKHHCGAEHGFRTVTGRGAGAQLFPVGNLRYIAHCNGHTAAMGHDDALNGRNVRNLARCADQVLLAISLDVPGADVRVVLFECLDHIFKAQVVGKQARRIGGDVELLFIAADRVDFGDAAYLPELRAYYPVLQGTQCSRVVGLTVGLPGRVIGMHRVQVDFTKTRRNRPHRGLDAARQLALGLLQPFVDEIAGPVDIGAVREDDRHLRQAVAGQRARVLQVRQTGDCHFNKVGDALLDFERRITGCCSINLHLDIRDVGDRINRQALVVPDAKGADHEDQKQYNPAAGDRETQQCIDHGLILVGCFALPQFRFQNEAVRCSVGFADGNTGVHL